MTEKTENLCIILLVIGIVIFSFWWFWELLKLIVPNL